MQILDQYPDRLSPVEPLLIKRHRAQSPGCLLWALCDAHHRAARSGNSRIVAPDGAAWRVQTQRDELQGLAYYVSPDGLVTRVKVDQAELAL